MKYVLTSAQSSALIYQIMVWAAYHDFEAEEYSPHCLRIKGGYRMIDVFPKSGKYNDITHKKWGNAKCLMTMLENYFNTLKSIT